MGGKIFLIVDTSPWVPMYFLIQKYIKSSVRIMARLLSLCTIATTQNQIDETKTSTLS